VDKKLAIEKDREEWRKLRKVRRNYFSPSIIRVVGSSRRRLVGLLHITRLGEMTYIYIYQSENVQERDHLGDLGIDERIILKLMLTNA
jgi:hypothetical protein